MPKDEEHAVKGTRALASAAAVAAAVVIAGCGGTEMNTNPSGSAPTSGAQPQVRDHAPHNEADVTFVRGMIPHHEQAIEMSRPAPERARSEQVENLAKQIESAQRPEIETMTGWLHRWGVPESSSNMPGMDHGDMSHGGTNMGEGMMSPQEMQQFDQARGAEFDRMFLSMMIKHHEGAVTMAQTELDKGQNPEAKQLAKKIIDSQKAEIDTMKRLLERE